MKYSGKGVSCPGDFFVPAGTGNEYLAEGGEDSDFFLGEHLNYL